MHEPDRILQPVEQANAQLERLTDYRTPAELAEALRGVARAVEESLRRLLRADDAAPDEQRMSAFSSEALPLGRVVESLRSRDRISFELAGGVHELDQAVRRAEAGQPRAADADHALRTVERLRRELRQVEDRALLAVAHRAVEEKRIEEPHPVEPPAAVGRRFGGRQLAVLAALVALGIILALAWVLSRGIDDEMDSAVAAFRAGRIEEAEAGFEAVLQDAPEDVTALLYLSRIYRRQERFDEAAEMLRRADAAAPDDADVDRELGLLLLDLDRPDLAARQFQRAVEMEPEESRNWIWLVRALRAANDPTAEEWLRRAPDEARAALGR